MDRHYRSQEDPRESISIALRVQLRLPLTPGVAVRVCARRQEGEKRGDSRLDKTGLARQIVRDRLTSLFDSIKTSRRGLRPPRNFDRPTTERKRRFFAAVGDSRRFLGVWSSDAVSRGWLSSVINGSTVPRRSQDNADYFSFFFFLERRVGGVVGIVDKGWSRVFFGAVEIFAIYWRSRGRRISSILWF